MTHAASSAPKPISGASVPKSSKPPRSAEQVLHLVRSVDEVFEEQLPGPRAQRRWGRWALVLIGLVVLAGAVAVAWPRLGAVDRSALRLEFHAAERGRLLFSVVEKGELESAKSADVICKVRSSGRGYAAASSIKWLVDDGTPVRKGDVIVRLDDAGLHEQAGNQEIVVAEKRELLIRAERDEEIVESQNRIDLQAAANLVKLTEIALNKYVQGDLEQKRQDLQGRMTLAEADLLQWRERHDWSERMVKRGYVTPTQAQADESQRQSAEINLRKLKEERRVLESFESQLNLLDLQNRLEQARESYVVAQIQAKSKEAQATARYQAALSVFRQEETKLEDIHEDIQSCTILAPNEGMILYNLPEQYRTSTQNLIAIGEPVREGQKLMRIPDLRRMQVRLKIHESLVSRLRGDRTRKTGFADVLHLAMTAGTYPSGQLATAIVAPHAHDDVRHLDEEVVELGMPASIRVPAHHEPLQGHVHWIAAVNSASDYMSSDVKVYTTLVTLDESFTGIKPGMSAEVTILVEDLPDVLQLPVQSVLEANGTHFCYVKTDDDTLEKRNLVTGMNNTRFVEIKEASDLAEGDLVVQNPRQLAEKLGDLHGHHHDPAEKIKIKDTKPSRNRTK